MLGGHGFDDIVPIQELDISQSLNTLSYMEFQEWAGGEIQLECFRIAELFRAIEHLVSAEQHPDARQVALIADRGAIRAEVVEDSGEQLFQPLCPSGHEHMDVVSLRYPATRSGNLVQFVTLDHRDRCVRLG
ncbi:Uncharacterised protein [Mycobacteroides abscessus subsp. abscessus]|nr:Uncharacterised protein [Mycobacteroides abscessus subsp. abscessus]